MDAEVCRRIVSADLSVLASPLGFLTKRLTEFYSEHYIPKAACIMIINVADNIIWDCISQETPGTN
jgi:hypothetical protein